MTCADRDPRPGPKPQRSDGLDPIRAINETDPRSAEARGSQEVDGGQVLMGGCVPGPDSCVLFTEPSTKTELNSPEEGQGISFEAERY